MPSTDPPQEVALIRKAIKDFMATRDDQGRTIGSAKCGIYAFFDYDGEPIYVGQTVEGLSARVGRHLTGRRSDAVAKFVLDPFEVLEIEVWPMPDLATSPAAEKKGIVNQTEYAVFMKALAESQFSAVLNEGEIRWRWRGCRRPRRTGPGCNEPARSPRIRTRPHPTTTPTEETE